MTSAYSFLGADRVTVDVVLRPIMLKLLLWIPSEVVQLESIILEVILFTHRHSLCNLNLRRRCIRHDRD